MAKRKGKTTKQAPEVITDPAALLDSMVSESHLQSDVIDAAHRHGYLVHHVYDSRIAGGRHKNGERSIDAGFPDLVLAREAWKLGQRGRLIFVELKDSHGYTSDAQKRWLAALRLAGVEAYVWRPADWRSGLIEAVLSAQNMGAA